MSSSDSSAPNKWRFSRRSSNQAGLSLQLAKKPQEGSPPNLARATKLDASSDEDVYIPSADPAASEISSTSGGELEDDDSDSDVVGVITARAKAVAVHNHAGGPVKWNAKAKRARYMEKYGNMMPEAALAKLAKAWRSPVYNHFKFPVIVTNKDEVIYYHFICKDHPSIYLDCIAHEDSTSNLLRHIRMCEPADMPESEALMLFAAGSTYSKAKFYFLLAIWCACQHRPFSIVEDPEFCKLVWMLYGRAEILSHISMSHDIQHLLEHSCTQLITKLVGLPGKIHLCVDGWTSLNYMSFLGMTAHWGDGNRLEQVTLDFIKLNKAHMGIYLTEKLAKSLKDYEIQDKVMALTCNNADNNNTMITTLKKQILGYWGHDMRVRCFGHVLNLIVKAILSQFSWTRTTKKAKGNKPTRSEFDAVLQDLNDPAEDERAFFEEFKQVMIPNDDSEDGEQTDDAHNEADEQIIDEIIKEQSCSLVFKKEDVLAGKKALEKIMVLLSHVFCRPQIRSVLVRLAKDAGLKSQVLVRPVRTCWNTVTNSLGCAIDMQDILEALCDMHQFNQPGRVHLCRFILSPDKWTILYELYDLLFPFLYATNKMSTNKHVLVHKVIPYMDILMEHLAKFNQGTILKPVVHAAAARGIEVINHYYSKTDHSMVYRVVMILHLGYKTQYFADHEWEPEWVDKALRLIREEWVKFYRPEPSTTIKQEDDCDGPDSKSSTCKMFESASQALSTKDALEEYLASSPTKSINDPITFWHLHLCTSLNNPGALTLGCMAMNFLTTPATSTDVERTFSCGGLTVFCLHHSLGNTSICTSALLGSWMRMPSIVDEADTVKLLKSKLQESCHSDTADKTLRQISVPMTKMAMAGITKTKTTVAAAALTVPSVKIKHEPVSDNDTCSATPGASSSKGKGIMHAGSAPKPHPIVKSGSVSSASSAGKGTMLSTPLVWHKSSKGKLGLTIPSSEGAHHADKRAKHVVHAPISDNQEILEILSDSPESEDD